MSENAADMQAVIATAQRAAEAQVIGTDLLWMPSAGNGEGRLEVRERFLDAPMRKRGELVVYDAASFNAVLEMHAKPGAAAVYLDRDAEKPSITAVLNDAGPEAPGWRDHRVELRFRPIVSWQRWRAVDGKLLPQMEFADFIETNRADIAEPAGADMVEIVTNLSVARSIAHKSNVRLGSGAVEFEFSDAHDAKVGGAKALAIPQVFTLALAPFLGVAPFRVPARFRYRLDEQGKVTMGLKLERIEDLMSAVVDEVVGKLARMDGVPVLEAQAPMPTRALER